MPPLKLDPEEYRAHLEEYDLTEEQENELLETLWHIMRTFVEIGFGVDSVQMFLAEKAEKSGQDSGNTLEQKNSTQHFNRAAIDIAAKEENDD